MSAARIGSLFSGAGALDLAVEALFGGRTVWQCEFNPAASTVLAARFPGVPNLGDITTVDWSTVSPIEVLCGGFPCQDVSAAGRRAGIAAGTRSGLWAYFAEAIDALRPPLVVIENVRGLLSAKAIRSGDVEPENATVGTGCAASRPVLRAAGAVLGDLADLGYDAQWATVAAASVGAPHKRERVFIVATDAQRPGLEPLDRLASTAVSDAEFGGARELATFVDLLPTPLSSDYKGGFYTTDPAKQRGLLKNMVAVMPTPQARDWRGGQSNQFDLNGAVRSLLPTPATADADRGPDFARAGREGSGGDDLVTICARATRQRGSNWGKYEPAIRHWEQLTRPASSPTELNTKGNPRLAAPFSEWMMGWPEGWVTALVDQSRTRPPGTISRNDALRIIGNGVVPKQAFAAIASLLNITAVSEVAA